MSTATALVLELDNLRDSLAPLFHRYPREVNPQGAFVEITEEGAVSADWNGEIGNAVPSHVWHGRTIRAPVSPFVRGADLLDFLERFDRGRVLLERIHEGHSVEWDGSNYVGSLNEDAQAAREELETALQELEQADVQRAEEWTASTPWADLWPSGKKLALAVERVEAEALASGTVLDGSTEEAILSRLWTESDWPSDLAKAGRWEDARRLWEHWTAAATAAGHQPRDLADDVEDLADAVESLWPETMSNLDGFDHSARRETLAEGRAEDEAEATLSEGLRWIKEDRPAGRMDLSWLSGEVTRELVRRRVEALEAWGRDNPETRRAHFTRFGVSLQPVEADQEGYLPYRDGFRHGIPAVDWTPAETWIAHQEEQIEEWRQGQR